MEDHISHVLKVNADYIIELEQRIEALTAERNKYKEMLQRGHGKLDIDCDAPKRNLFDDNDWTR